MKFILGVLITILFSSCTSGQIEKPYKISFDMRHVEFPKDRNIELPDFRKLCKAEIEKFCFVSFKIRNPEIPEPPPEAMFKNIIRGTISGPVDYGLYVNAEISVKYDELGVIWTEDDDGIAWKLRVLIPKPGSEKSPAYIFTQKSEPRYVAIF